MKPITGGLPGWTGTEIRKSNLLDVEEGRRAWRVWRSPEMCKLSEGSCPAAWVSDVGDKKRVSCHHPPSIVWHSLAFRH